MNNLIEVGIITKPQGIRGQVKIKSLAFGNFDFKTAKCLYVDGVPFEVEECFFVKDDVVIKFKEINSIDNANRLKNKSVYAKKDQVINNNGYFCAELLGLTVVTENGESLGVVDDIQNFGSADVFYVKGKKPFLFSNIGGIIKTVNFEEGKIVVSKSALEEVMVYED